jgi:uncharacterized membrane protein
MLKYVDRTLAAILIFGAGGHTLGSIKTYGDQPILLLWALCASVLVALLGALNLLRERRPHDRALAWITLADTFCWLVSAIVFGWLIGKVFDVRIVVFALTSAGLIGFGLQTALGRPTGE